MEKQESRYELADLRCVRDFRGVALIAKYRDTYVEGKSTQRVDAVFLSASNDATDAQAFHYEEGREAEAEFVIRAWVDARLQAVRPADTPLTLSPCTNEGLAQLAFDAPELLRLVARVELSMCGGEVLQDRCAAALEAAEGVVTAKPLDIREP